MSRLALFFALMALFCAICNEYVESITPREHENLAEALLDRVEEIATNQKQQTIYRKLSNISLYGTMLFALMAILSAVTCVFFRQEMSVPNLAEIITATGMAIPISFTTYSMALIILILYLVFKFKLQKS